MTNPGDISTKTLAAIDLLFEDLPNTYPEIEFHLSALQNVFRSKVAKSLEPQLNSFLKQLRPDAHTHSELRQIVALINGELASLGICANVNGEPALLITERANGLGSEETNFAVIVRAKNKSGFERKIISNTMPILELMAAPENNDAYMRPLVQHASAFMRN